MPYWRQVKNYTRNTLFEDFEWGLLFTREQFIEKGQKNYLLQKITCQQKFLRGIREEFIKEAGKHYYCRFFKAGWRRTRGYNKKTLLEDFQDQLFFRWQDFRKRGRDKYDLKKSTCRQKLWWAVRKGWIIKMNRDLYFFSS